MKAMPEGIRRTRQGGSCFGRSRPRAVENHSLAFKKLKRTRKTGSFRMRTGAGSVVAQIFNLPYRE